MTAQEFDQITILAERLTIALIAAVLLSDENYGSILYARGLPPLPTAPSEWDEVVKSAVTDGRKIVGQSLRQVTEDGI